MDALSDMLRVVGLTGGVFLDASFTAPWSVAGQVSPELCAPFMAQPQQVVAFHYVVEGEFELGIEGHPPQRVTAGQAVMLPHNDVHTFGSSARLRATPVSALIELPGPSEVTTLVHGGGGAVTRLVCGYLGGAEPLSFLLAALPKVMVLDVDRSPGGDWIGATFAFAAETARRQEPGGAAVLTKLSELLFVESLRHHLAALDPGATGWLAALRDPMIGRALTLLHERVAEPWTAEALAREVGMSRSAFADRFAAIVGQPPMRYLTAWRMQLARRRLADTRAAIAQIAFEVGYDSEAGFARAFRRECGAPPGEWRRAAG